MERAKTSRCKLLSTKEATVRAAEEKSDSEFLATANLRARLALFLTIRD